MHETVILIVDDNRDIRSMLAAILVDDDHYTVQATHGVEALDYLKDGLEPDVVISDLQMPIEDGVFVGDDRKPVQGGAWLYEQIKHLPHQPPFVLLTGSADELPAHVDFSDAAAILSKPFELDELLDLVRNLVDDGQPVRVSAAG